MLSLNNIRDIILNGVHAGLKGVTNFSESREQVMAEIHTTRARIIMESYRNGFLPLESYYQPLHGIKMKYASKSAISFQGWHEGDIPPIMAISETEPMKYSTRYCGGPDLSRSFRIIEGNRYECFKNSTMNRLHAKDPVAHLSATKVRTLYNSCETMALEAVFMNPMDLAYFGDKSFSEDARYPMPEGMIDILTGRLIESYLRMYIGRTSQPNTQTEASSNEK